MLVFVADLFPALDSEWSLSYFPRVLSGPRAFSINSTNNEEKKLALTFYGT